MRMLPARGIVPVLQSAESDVEPLPLKKNLDFRSGDAFTNILAQLNPLIGMTAVDSLSYAPHALQQVHSLPINLAADPNDFRTASWSRNAGVTIAKANLRQSIYTEGTGTSNLGQIIENGLEGQKITTSWRVAKEEISKIKVEWIRLSRWATAGFCAGMVNIFDGSKGEAEESTGASTVHDYGAIDRGDEWEVFLTASLDGEIEAQHDIHTCIGGSVVDGRVRVAGGQMLLAECMVYAGDRRDISFQNNNGIGARENYIFSGDAASRAYQEFIEGNFYLVLDNTGGAINASANWGEFSIPEILYSLSTEWFGSGNARLRMGGSLNNPPWEALPSEPTTHEEYGQRPGSVNSAQIEIQPGAKAYFRLCEQVEGMELFGLRSSGEAFYGARCEGGIGRLCEKDGGNDCQNYSLAPTDTTNVGDGANATTTAVDRASLPAGLLAALDANPKYINVRAMYRTQISGGGGRAYVTGPAGNTNEHFIRALMWAEAGSGGIALELFDLAPISGTGSLEWVGGKVTPAAGTDRLAVYGADGADIYWIANGMFEESTAHSHVPVAGSSRLRNADRVFAKTDSLGIDQRRNSIPSSNMLDAVVGEIGGGGAFPPTWSSAEQNGWQMEIVAKGKTSKGSYLDVRFTGNPTGSVWIYPVTSMVIAAAQGQTWKNPISLALIAGDYTNVDTLGIELVELDGAGGYLAGSIVYVQNLLGSQLRRMNVSRTMGNAATAFMRGGVVLGGSAGAAVDLTLRLADWSHQHIDEIVEHLETDGSEVAYQQWLDGLTVVDQWDIEYDRGREYARMNMGFLLSDITNERIEVLNSDGANTDKVYTQIRQPLNASIIPAGVPTKSYIGEHVYQNAYAEGDQEFWVDGASEGTATEIMPRIDVWLFGDHPSTDYNRDGIQKRIAFFDGRATTAGAVGSGFDAGFDEGF